MQCQYVYMVPAGDSSNIVPYPVIVKSSMSGIATFGTMFSVVLVRKCTKITNIFLFVCFHCLLMRAPH